MGLIANQLGEGFRALELGRRLAMAENLDAARPERIGQARHQRTFRAHHDKADLHEPAELQHRSMVIHRQHDIAAALFSAGIAWRDEQPGQERAGGQSLSQRMFAPARANQKNIHRHGLAPNLLAFYRR